MSVTLTGQEGYFTRQGAFIGEYNRVSALYGSALDVGFQSIWIQFASSDQAAVQQLPDAVSTFRQTSFNYQNELVSDGQSASQLQTNRDADLIPYTFQQSINVIAAQMRSTVQSINRPTLTTTVTPGGSNLGDTTVAVSTTNPYGDPLDMVFAETVTVKCTADSGLSFQSSLTATGEQSVPSSSWNWPQGSAASLFFSVSDPTLSTLITDGAFENWTGNTPDDWAIVNGAAGTEVTKGTGGVRSTSAFTAVITSNGSQATQLTQAVSLNVNTVYAVCVYAKRNTSDGTGLFRIALVNADTDAVINNDAGTALSVTKTLNAQVTGSFQCFTVFFSTPRQLPLNVELRMGYSTAPANGVFLTLDMAALIVASQLYTGGPYIAAFAGATRTALNDTYSVAVTNSLTSQSFARGMDRLYQMRSLGVYLPSSTSPTISDSLVTH